MDISKTCFRVSLMNFHLKKTPSKEDAGSVMVFCLKQRETLSSGFPPLWSTPEEQSAKNHRWDHLQFYFQAPQPFQIVFTPSKPSDQPGWASWQPHLAGSQILWLRLSSCWSVGDWLMERLLCDAHGKRERIEEFRCEGDILLENHQPLPGGARTAGLQ